MITLEDCIAMCGLTREEIDAVAGHEHLPEAAAAAYAAWLLRTRNAGIPKIRNILRDDVRAAIATGDPAHAAELLAALRHFITHHPENP